MNVKNLKIIYRKIQYGEVCMNGGLGYDNNIVSIKERYYENSISAHPPSHLMFKTNGEYNNFSCEVALNDTSSEDASADFYIYADNNLVACCFNVIKNENPRKIQANINFCDKLTLKIHTNNPLFCHAIWIDPVVDINFKNEINGCMGDIIIDSQLPNINSDICIATCISPEYIEFGKIFLESIKLNSNLKNFKIVLFSFNTNEDILKLSEDYDCLIVNCKLENRGFFSKTAIYSVAKIFDANKYLLIDIDTVVQKPIDHIFENLNIVSKKTILLAREQMTHENLGIGKLITRNEWPYFGSEYDKSLLKISEKQMFFNFICNGGVIFGSKDAILALDDMIRSLMPGSNIWEKSNINVKWREQGILNLAISKLNNALQLDKTYNYQLLHNSFDDINDAHIVHFNGENGKNKFNKYKLKQFYLQEFSLFDYLIIKYNNLFQNGFDLRNNVNLKFINFDDFQAFDKIAIINDTWGFYTAKYLKENKNVTVFEWNNTIKNFKFYDFFQKENLEVVYEPDKNVHKYTNFDILIIECHESEQKTLSQFLIYKDILNSNGRLFIVESAKHTNPYIKERIIEKNYEIVNYDTFFEVKLNKEI